VSLKITILIHSILPAPPQRKAALQCMSFRSFALNSKKIDGVISDSAKIANLRQELALRMPNDYRVLTQAIFAHWSLAESFFDAKRFGDFLKHNELASEIGLRLATQFPRVEGSKATGAASFGRSAAAQLYNRKFGDVEKSSLKGIEIDGTAIWIKSCIARSLLYQGKFESARELFVENKKTVLPNENMKTFGELCLNQLTQMEQAGIEHPDVKRIRAILEEKPLQSR
jgi:hypothetical protein